MIRHQYDNDITVWNPQGRLMQLDYATQSVNLGLAVVGLKSRDFAVLVAKNPPSRDLSYPEEKVISIGKMAGFAYSGAFADARRLTNYLRSEYLSYQYTYEKTYPMGRLATNLGLKMHATTRSYGQRPYAVGLLIAGYDGNGPHIYQVMPSSEYFSCKAMSIGASSQSARTYLEQQSGSFPDCSKDEIICHGIKAIKTTIPAEEPVAERVLSFVDMQIAIVGKDQEFSVLDDDETRHYADMAQVGVAAAEEEPM